ncbi:hypothetical protein ADUPG1_009246 [Aduncisulcus paluster]|uniref:Uncharacterized protein n=1 Tax=Aduncisulcus paluster TaxID=2918883 RepID=A0ABQ5KUY6_9EUKA|nr:hypothetical protein ADUPG1_009246 [Aduncisulcus paluster]
MNKLLKIIIKNGDMPSRELIVGKHISRQSEATVLKPDHTIFVGNIPELYIVDDIKAIFGRYGKISHCVISRLKPRKEENPELQSELVAHVGQGARLAHVVYKESKAVERLFSPPRDKKQKVKASSTSGNIGLTKEIEYCRKITRTPLLEYAEYYAITHFSDPHLCAERAERFVKAYDELVEAEEAEKLKRFGKPDEQGWITIESRKGGRRKDIVGGKDGFQAISISQDRLKQVYDKQQAQMYKKDFYMFQTREQKKQKFEQMQKSIKKRDKFVEVSLRHPNIHVFMAYNSSIKIKSAETQIIKSSLNGYFEMTDESSSKEQLLQPPATFSVLMNSSDSNSITFFISGEGIYRRVDDDDNIMIPDPSSFLLPEFITSPPLLAAPIKTLLPLPFPLPFGTSSGDDFSLVWFVEMQHHINSSLKHTNCNQLFELRLTNSSFYHAGSFVICWKNEDTVNFDTLVSNDYMEDAIRVMVECDSNIGECTIGLGMPDDQDNPSTYFFGVRIHTNTLGHVHVSVEEIMASVLTSDQLESLVVVSTRSSLEVFRDEEYDFVPFSASSIVKSDGTYPLLPFSQTFERFNHRSHFESIQEPFYLSNSQWQGEMGLSESMLFDSSQQISTSYSLPTILPDFFLVPILNFPVAPSIDSLTYVDSELVSTVYVNHVDDSHHRYIFNNSLGEEIFIVDFDNIGYPLEDDEGQDFGGGLMIDSTMDSRDNISYQGMMNINNNVVCLSYIAQDTSNSDMESTTSDTESSDRSDYVILSSLCLVSGAYSSNTYLKIYWGYGGDVTIQTSKRAVIYPTTTCSIDNVSNSSDILAEDESISDEEMSCGIDISYSSFRGVILEYTTKWGKLGSNWRDLYVTDTHVFEPIHQRQMLMSDESIVYNVEDTLSMLSQLGSGFDVIIGCEWDEETDYGTKLLLNSILFSCSIAEETIIISIYFYNESDPTVSEELPIIEIILEMGVDSSFSCSNFGDSIQHYPHSFKNIGEESFVLFPTEDTSSLTIHNGLVLNISSLSVITLGINSDRSTDGIIPLADDCSSFTISFSHIDSDSVDVFEQSDSETKIYTFVLYYDTLSDSLSGDCKVNYSSNIETVTFTTSEKSEYWATKTGLVSKNRYSLTFLINGSHSCLEDESNISGCFSLSKNLIIFDGGEDISYCNTLYIDAESDDSESVSLISFTLLFVEDASETELAQVHIDTDFTVSEEEIVVSVSIEELPYDTITHFELTLSDTQTLVFNLANSGNIGVYFEDSDEDSEDSPVITVSLIDSFTNSILNSVDINEMLFYVNFEPLFSADSTNLPPAFVSSFGKCVGVNCEHGICLGKDTLTGKCSCQDGWSTQINSSNQLTCSSEYSNSSSNGTPFVHSKNDSMTMRNRKNHSQIILSEGSKLDVARPFEYQHDIIFYAMQNSRLRLVVSDEYAEVLFSKLYDDYSLEISFSSSATLTSPSITTGIVIEEFIVDHYNGNPFTLHYIPFFTGHNLESAIEANISIIELLPDMDDSDNSSNTYNIDKYIIGVTSEEKKSLLVKLSNKLPSVVKEERVEISYFIPFEEWKGEDSEYGHLTIGVEFHDLKGELFDISIEGLMLEEDYDLIIGNWVLLENVTLNQSIFDTPSFSSSVGKSEKGTWFILQHSHSEFGTDSGDSSEEEEQVSFYPIMGIFIGYSGGVVIVSAININNSYSHSNISSSHEHSLVFTTLSQPIVYSNSISADVISFANLTYPCMFSFSPYRNEESEASLDFLTTEGIVSGCSFGIIEIGNYVTNSNGEELFSRTGLNSCSCSSAHYGNSCSFSPYRNEESEASLDFLTTEGIVSGCSFGIIEIGNYVTNSNGEELFSRTGLNSCSCSSAHYGNSCSYDHCADQDTSIWGHDYLSKCSPFAQNYVSTCDVNYYMFEVEKGEEGEISYSDGPFCTIMVDSDANIDIYGGDIDSTNILVHNSARVKLFGSSITTDMDSFVLSDMLENIIGDSDESYYGTSGVIEIINPPYPNSDTLTLYFQLSTLTYKVAVYSPSSEEDFTFQEFLNDSISGDESFLFSIPFFFPFCGIFADLISISNDDGSVQFIPYVEIEDHVDEYFAIVGIFDPSVFISIDYSMSFDNDLLVFEICQHDVSKNNFVCLILCENGSIYIYYPSSNILDSYTDILLVNRETTLISSGEVYQAGSVISFAPFVDNIEDFIQEYPITCVNGSITMNNGNVQCVCEDHWKGDSCDTCSLAYWGDEREGCVRPNCQDKCSDLWCDAFNNDAAICGCYVSSYVTQATTLDDEIEGNVDDVTIPASVTRTLKYNGNMWGTESEETICKVITGVDNLWCDAFNNDAAICGCYVSSYVTQATTLDDEIEGNVDDVTIPASVTRTLKYNGNMWGTESEETICKVITGVDSVVNISDSDILSSVLSASGSSLNISGYTFGLNQSSFLHPHTEVDYESVVNECGSTEISWSYLVDTDSSFIDQHSFCRIVMPESLSVETDSCDDTIPNYEIDFDCSESYSSRMLDKDVTYLPGMDIDGIVGSVASFSKDKCGTKTECNVDLSPFWAFPFYESPVYSIQFVLGKILLLDENDSEVGYIIPVNSSIAMEYDISFNDSRSFTGSDCFCCHEKIIISSNLETLTLSLSIDVILFRNGDIDLNYKIQGFEDFSAKIRPSLGGKVDVPSIDLPSYSLFQEELSALCIESTEEDVGYTEFSVHIVSQTSSATLNISSRECSDPCVFGECVLDDSNSEYCKCGIRFSGSQCEECVGGWTTDNSVSGSDDNFCDVPTCSFFNSCHGHGTCSGDLYTGLQECLCDEGYCGTACSVSVPSMKCSPSCENGGICFLGECNCVDGFSGDDCSLQQCSIPSTSNDSEGSVETDCNSKNGGGECDNETGLCVCNEYFSGDECLDYTTPEECINGIKAGTVCICPDNYYGQYCQCKNNCLPYGACREWGCECQDGYSGISCDVIDIPVVSQVEILLDQVKFVIYFENPVSLKGYSNSTRNVDCADMIHSDYYGFCDEDKTCTKLFNAESSCFKAVDGYSFSIHPGFSSWIGPDLYFVLNTNVVDRVTQFHGEDEIIVTLNRDLFLPQKPLVLGDYLIPDETDVCNLDHSLIIDFSGLFGVGWGFNLIMGQLSLDWDEDREELETVNSIVKNALVTDLPSDMTSLTQFHGEDEIIVTLNRDLFLPQKPLVLGDYLIPDETDVCNLDHSLIIDFSGLFGVGWGFNLIMGQLSLDWDEDREELETVNSIVKNALVTDLPSDMTSCSNIPQPIKIPHALLFQLYSQYGITSLDFIVQAKSIFDAIWSEEKVYSVDFLLSGVTEIFRLIKPISQLSLNSPLFMATSLDLLRCFMDDSTFEFDLDIFYSITWLCINNDENHEFTGSGVFLTMPSDSLYLGEYSCVASLFKSDDVTPRKIISTSFSVVQPSIRVEIACTNYFDDDEEDSSLYDSTDNAQNVSHSILSDYLVYPGSTLLFETNTIWYEKDDIEFAWKIIRRNTMELIYYGIGSSFSFYVPKIVLERQQYVMEVFTHNTSDSSIDPHTFSFEIAVMDGDDRDIPQNFDFNSIFPNEQYRIGVPTESIHVMAKLAIKGPNIISLGQNLELIASLNGDLSEYYVEFEWNLDDIESEDFVNYVKSNLISIGTLSISAQKIESLLQLILADELVFSLDVSFYNITQDNSKGKYVESISLNHIVTVEKIIFLDGNELSYHQTLDNGTSAYGSESSPFVCGHYDIQYTNVLDMSSSCPQEDVEFDLINGFSCSSDPSMLIKVFPTESLPSLWISLPNNSRTLYGPSYFLSALAQYVGEDHFHRLTSSSIDSSLNLYIPCSSLTEKQLLTSTNEQETVLLQIEVSVPSGENVTFENDFYFTYPPHYNVTFGEEDDISTSICSKLVEELNSVLRQNQIYLASILFKIERSITDMINLRSPRYIEEFQRFIWTFADYSQSAIRSAQRIRQCTAIFGSESDISEDIYDLYAQSIAQGAHGLLSILTIFTQLDIDILDLSSLDNLHIYEIFINFFPSILDIFDRVELEYEMAKTLFKDDLVKNRKGKKITSQNGDTYQTIE